MDYLVANDSCHERVSAAHLQIASEVSILAFLPSEALRAATPVLAVHFKLGEKVGHDLSWDDVANVIARGELGESNAANLAVL